jgi:hypothetical protein
VAREKIDDVIPRAVKLFGKLSNAPVQLTTLASKKTPISGLLNKSVMKLQLGAGLRGRFEESPFDQEWNSVGCLRR